jgi:rubrerythrin
MNRRDFLGTAAVGVTGALGALADSSAQPNRRTGATAWLCVTCGTQFPSAVHPPPECPICQGSRQYPNSGYSYLRASIG